MNGDRSASSLLIPVIGTSARWRLIAAVTFACLLHRPETVAEVNPQEQLLIYELNRARNSPVRYQLENSTIVTADLSSVAAQMPLALNPDLIDTAQFRAEEMAVNNYCAHMSAVTGLWPNHIARGFGYQLPAFYPDDDNNIESIFCESGPTSLTNTVAEDGLAALIEDDGITPPGHRITLLAIDQFFQANREIGAGIVSVPEVVGGFAGMRARLAVETTQVTASNLFLTGVVYDDTNLNLRYDLNEGLGGVTISDGATNAVLSGAAGGWAMPVTPGAYTVIASGGPFSGVASAQVVVVDKNIEIDFSSGNNLGEVDFSNQIAHADLSVKKTDAPDPVMLGANLTYTITVRNNGPNAATGVTMTDTLPDNVTFVSAASTHGSCTQAAGIVTCDLGALANGVSATTTIIVTPTATNQICNTAGVAANESDPVSTNNAATACTTIKLPIHDLAVVTMKAPKKITLSATVTNVVGKFSVTIQNRSDHAEIIPGLATLTNLVTLVVHSLGACPDITAVMVPPKTKFPITLASKKRLTVAFVANFNCANDPLATKKTAAHNDYRTVATVHHDALPGGAPDSHPEDDNCPHAALPGGIDPNPDGTIKDKGCGGKNPDGTLGADVLTDVVQK